MMANIITGFRVLLSIALLFCQVFSPVFYVLYLIAGVSDMIDGTIARRTNTVSEFGARFDTAADLMPEATLELPYDGTKEMLLADPKFLKYKGFEVGDEADNGIQLWYLPFEKGAETPVFKECAKHPHIDSKGYVLY